MRTFQLIVEKQTKLVVTTLGCATVNLDRGIHANAWPCMAHHNNIEGKTR